LFYNLTLEYRINNCSKINNKQNKAKLNKIDITKLQKSTQVRKKILDMKP